MKNMSWWDRLLDLFEEEETSSEPVYDPVHLGSVVIACMAGIGALYWLLWTLLVYEGGIFPKVSAAARVLFTSETARDYGYEGPHALGAFEGWIGNLAALALLAGVIAALHRLHGTAASRRR